MSIQDDWELMGTMERIDFIAGKDKNLRKTLISQAKREGFLK